MTGLNKQSQAMIGEFLNFNGESIVAVMLPRETTEQSETEFKAIMDKVTEEYYPELTGWMAKQQVSEKAHECKTLEELEAVKIDAVPTTFFKDIAEKLNAIDTINDSERIYLLAQLSDRIIYSSTEYIRTIMHERAQRIMSQKPKILL